MPQLTEADRYLLQQIAGGDSSAWSQLVQRYQGRLLAFARGRLHRKDDAEDLVQDTFIAFLESVASGKFRENASVETFLFTILRHKLIDLFRSPATMRVCFLQDVLERQAGGGSGGGSSGGGGSGGGDARSPQMEDSQQLTASFYVRRDEQSQMLRAALSNALEALAERLQAAQNLRDLQIIEMLFYAQIRNKDAAAIMGMDEKQIALVKHRAIKEIHEHVVAHGRLGRADAPMLDTPAWENAASTASLLSEVWEEQRPTCPKRSTIGRFLLGTLEPQWQSYVDFHVNRLGCQFCKANLDDLKKETTEEPKAVYDRVLQSTVGFFRKT
jgi:RNA polymerase sigma factor (sigma-70 family)